MRAPARRLFPATPWISHPERPWLFAPLARRNDFEGAFQLMEERARARLREAELQKLQERAERMEAARARGEDPAEEVDEHTRPWKQLTKKGRKRVRGLLLSTDPAIRVLGSVPRDELIDALQAFAAEGKEEAMEYIYRRMNQMGVPFDEEIASRWLAGIIVAASKRRARAAAEERMNEEIKQLDDEAEQQQRLAASDSGNAAAATANDSTAPTSDSGSAPASAPVSKLKLSRGRLDLSPENVARHDPTSVALARASSTALGVGLPCTRLVRVQVDLVMAWLDRYAFIPSYRIVQQIFEALAIDNDLHGAVAFITRLHRMKYYVSGFTYAVLIQALAKHQNSEGCMFVFLHMERAKFAPHAATFNMLISSFARLGDYTTAYRLMQDMQRHKLTPDNRTFASLIEACARANKLDMAEEMLQYFKTFHARLTRSVRVHSVKNIKLIGIENAPDDERRHVTLELGPEPFEALLQGYLLARRLPDAIRVLNEMITSAAPLKPSSRSYALLLDECLRQGRPLEVARQLWEQALSVGVKPTARLYLAYMRHVPTFALTQNLYMELITGSSSLTGDEDVESGHSGSDGQTDVVSSASTSSSTFHAPMQPTLHVFQELLNKMGREKAVHLLPWLLAQMREQKVAPTLYFLQQLCRFLFESGRGAHALLLRHTFIAQGEKGLTDEFAHKLAFATQADIQPELTELMRAHEKKLVPTSHFSPNTETAEPDSTSDEPTTSAPHRPTLQEDLAVLPAMVDQFQSEAASAAHAKSRSP